MNEFLKNVSHTEGGQFLLLVLWMVNFKDLHCKDFASVATWGYVIVASTCLPRNSSLSTLSL